MRMTIKSGLGAFGLGLATFLGAADAADDVPGPIDSVQDLQDTGKMLFKLADANNDGQISQREAVDAGNMMVGGFFFRTDANGDGVISKQEAQQARDQFLNNKPVLRAIIESNKNVAGANSQPNPAQMLGTLLDSNTDKNLQASELRQAVQTAVQGLYATADTNRDGQMSPSEINAAIVGLGKAVAQAAFQQADGDNNGQISMTEFDKAIVEPSRALFRAMDVNKDNQLSPQEVQAAEQFIASQLRGLQVPEPANSPRRLMQTGMRPDQAAPVPTFGASRRIAPASPPRHPAESSLSSGLTLEQSSAGRGPGRLPSGEAPARPGVPHSQD